MEKIYKNFSVTDEPVSMCNSLKTNYNKSVDKWKELKAEMDEMRGKIEKLEAEKETKGKK